MQIQEDLTFKSSFKLPKSQQNLREDLNMEVENQTRLNKAVEKMEDQKAYDYQGPISQEEIISNSQQSEQQSSIPQPLLIKKKTDKTFKKKTVLTEDRLKEMYCLFREYQENQRQGDKHGQVLKDISKRLAINYRTVLIRYKEFRQMGQNVLTPLQRPKVKIYNRNRIIIKHIRDSIKTYSFRSAAQLTRFINIQFDTHYNRHQVSKYLKILEYRPAHTHFIPSREEPHYESLRTKLKKVLNQIVQSHRPILFFGQKWYQRQGENNIYVIVLCGKKGMVYKCLAESDTSHLLEELIEDYKSAFGLGTNWLLVTGVEEIGHGSQKQQEDKCGKMKKSIIRKGGKLFCLPQGHSDLNPAKTYATVFPTKTQDGRIPNLFDIWNELNCVREACLATFDRVLNRLFASSTLKTDS